MTKNSPAKKAARNHARDHGISYTAARRRLAADSPAPRVLATYTFCDARPGASAPAPVTVDVTDSMPLLTAWQVRDLIAAKWEWDPSILSLETDPLPDFLDLCADGHEFPDKVRAAARWVAQHTVDVGASVTVADPFDNLAETELFELSRTYPWTLTFTRPAADQWAARHAPVPPSPPSSLTGADPWALRAPYAQP